MKTACKLKLQAVFNFTSYDDRIQTCDIVVKNATCYQAALLPDSCSIATNLFLFYKSNCMRDLNI